MPCQGQHAGRVFQVATPCCWENLPDFSDYRGETELTASLEITYKDAYCPLTVYCGESREAFRPCSGIFFVDGVKRDKWIWCGDAFQAFCEPVSDGRCGHQQPDAVSSLDCTLPAGNKNVHSMWDGT
ncbi:MAG: hypothetical protein K2I96_05465 [Lachnospiraceae bacterium]|nr:hypothetical protein [Lachnospiraceae bacterium]